MRTHVGAPVCTAGYGGQMGQGEDKQDKCKLPAPDCASTCSTLAPTRGAGSHYTNTNTKQAIYSLNDLPPTLLSGADIHIIY